MCLTFSVFMVIVKIFSDQCHIASSTPGKAVEINSVLLKAKPTTNYFLQKSQFIASLK